MDGQRRRVAAASRIRIQGLARKMEGEIKQLFGSAEHIPHRSKKKIASRYIQKGEVKTFLKWN